MTAFDKLWVAGGAILGIFFIIGVASSGIPAAIGVAGLSLVEVLATIPLWGWIVIVLLLVVLGRQRCS